jgi:hypothetical protein
MSVCSIGLENRGPIGTYSNSRSSWSKMMIERGDLCASSKIYTASGQPPWRWVLLCVAVEGDCYGATS